MPAFEAARHQLESTDVESFPHLQPELDQPADGFGATRQIRLPTPPAIDQIELIIPPPLTDERAHPRRRTADLLFVVRNACLLHDFMLTERKAEGKRRPASAHALALLGWTLGKPAAAGLTGGLPRVVEGVARGFGPALPPKCSQSKNEPLAWQSQVQDEL